MTLEITDHAHERMCRRKVKLGWIKRCLYQGHTISVEDGRSGKTVGTKLGDLTVIYERRSDYYYIITVWINKGE